MKALLVCFIFCLLSCSTKKKKIQENLLGFDSTIMRQAVYKKMDGEKELLCDANRDSSPKRTSDVAYFAHGRFNYTDSNSARNNRCNVILHGDTLSIRFGCKGWPVSSGFVIHYQNNRFYTEPYYSTDEVFENEPKPVYDLVYQRLILDKRTYRKDDSLYGRIDFKSIEMNRYIGRIEHTGTGYFRTKVQVFVRPY